MIWQSESLSHGHFPPRDKIDAVQVISQPSFEQATLEALRQPDTGLATYLSLTFISTT